jgi:hypothetical protein
MEWLMKLICSTARWTRPKADFLFVDENVMVGVIKQILLSGLPGNHLDWLSSLGELNYWTYILLKTFSNEKKKVWTEIVLWTGLKDEITLLSRTKHWMSVEATDFDP